MKKVIAIVAVMVSLTSSSAWAYLDPGTGSMLLQVILGGVAAVGIAFKLFWYKIKVALGLAKKQDAADEVADGQA